MGKREPVLKARNTYERKLCHKCGWLVIHRNGRSVPHGFCKLPSFTVERAPPPSAEGLTQDRPAERAAADDNGKEARSGTVIGDAR